MSQNFLKEILAHPDEHGEIIPAQSAREFRHIPRVGVNFLELCGIVV